jgi:murein L,D-transpeptidase YafK
MRVCSSAGQRWPRSLLRIGTGQWYNSGPLLARDTLRRSPCTAPEPNGNEQEDFMQAGSTPPLDRARARQNCAAVVVVAFLASVAATPLVAQGTPLGTPVPAEPLGQPASVEPSGGFLAHQLAFSRVAQARMATDQRLRALFAQHQLEYPASEIFIRVFKHERILQLWARSDVDTPFTLVTEYSVCALPGQLGPKQRLGDLQVPEGFYFIDQFNPESAYHLSLRVDYPNLADRMRGIPIALGGDIFIHGGCETVGCVPIEDDNIQEVYWLAAQSMEAGQRVIPVHIFPARLDPRRLQWLEETFRPEARLLDFWKNLAEGYEYFEDTRRVPWVTVGEDGRYVFPAVGSTAGGSADVAGEATPPPDLD